MDEDSVKKLRLDRRLLNRRGWIAPAEAEAELAALPDVSDKIDPSEPAAEPASGSESLSSPEPVRAPGDGAGTDGA